MFLERTTPKGRAGGLIPASPKIYAHLPYVIELDNEVVRTRDNALMLSLEVTGIDGVTSGAASVAASVVAAAASVAASVVAAAAAAASSAAFWAAAASSAAFAAAASSAALAAAACSAAASWFGL